ncbi:MAG: bile acid:sodium symporter [Bacteroidales bacterium]|nr:bile acid:sodium symporter [Bacteroidales bacterium]
MKVLQFIKNHALPIAIIIGSIFYDFFEQFKFVLPYSLFVMLLLSFSKISLNEIKIKKVHLVLLSVIIFGAMISYFAIAPFNKVLAESVMVIVMCPTATAAVVVTTKLGGQGANVISFTILSNVAAAIIIPSVFPLIEPHDSTFINDFWTIIKKVFPLLVLPMIVAQILKKVTPKIHKFLQDNAGVSFYIWAVSVVILMGRTVKAIVNNPENYHSDILMGIASLAVCIILFTVGKIIGSKMDDRISCGQNIGQKNTIFAIWVAGEFLNPLSALGSGLYIIFQNLFNAWQLDKKRHQEEKKLNKKQN